MTREAEAGTLASARRLLDRVLAATLAALMGALVLDVLWQVFARFGLGNPSSFTDELARFLLIWVGLLGAAYALGQRLHLAIDLLPRKATGRTKHALQLVIHGVVLAFVVAVLIGGGTRLVGLTLLLGQTSAALGVPLGYVYTALPISGVVMAFYLVADSAAHVRGLRSGDAARRASRSEEGGR